MQYIAYAIQTVLMYELRGSGKGSLITTKVVHAVVFLGSPSPRGYVQYRKVSYKHQGKQNDNSRLYCRTLLYISSRDGEVQ